jgi:UDP-3-O-[3-hydroxymyristoyl] glucosamine N-acyltransferase
MRFSLGDIAKIIDGELIGDKRIKIGKVCEPSLATQGDLVFLFGSKFFKEITNSQASAFVVPQDFSFEELLPLKGKKKKSIIKVSNPRLALAKVLEKLSQLDKPTWIIHNTVVLGKKVKVEKSIAIGAFSIIGDGSVLGDKTVIYPQVYIGKGVKIGPQCRIYPQVVIYDGVELGGNIIIHSGCVIGADGFGFEFDNGHYKKIPQNGTVIIGDDVELGANVTVDRAVFGATRIGRGTKIDNGCQIAHNVVIGQDCVIASHAAIAGSTSIGDRVRIGGVVAIRDNIKIGKDVTIAGRSAVTKDIPDGKVVSGFPARDHQQELEFQARLQKIIKQNR